MTNTQIDQKKMFDVSINHLDAHAAVFENNLPINEAIKRAKAKQSLIAEANLKQGIVKTGIVKDKDELLFMTGKKAYMIGGMVNAFAIANNNQTLKQRVDYSITDLTAARGSDCVNRFKIIRQVAQEYSTELIPYGLTSEIYDAYDKLVQDSETSLSLPRQASTISSTATQTLTTLFYEMNHLFKETIDKLLLQFEESHPEFYFGYLKARIVIPSSGGRTSKSDPNTPAAQ